ncbi:MAG TPA: alpha/beta hydrolase [Acidobacteriaceae bacterium]|jgi:pimeloyl-ACP methyl ester carboxylesterase|nr:alpha/beta hydrolase [Acidobacteriaceae bacterium]
MLIVASIVGSLAALILLGMLYQRVGALRDRQRYTGSGRWVDIGRGCNLYLLESGPRDSGGPTVLFESGIAATNLNWSRIQDTVSQFAHTASYDRGGLGWSSPASTPRTPGNIASELHTMLESAGIKPPYVLVGHSFGGLVVRRYALLYPEDVAGIVLVDPMRCEEWPPLDPTKQATLNRGSRLTGYAIPIAGCGLARLAVTSLLCRSGRLSDTLAGATGSGGKHVLSRIKVEVGKMPRETWPMVAAHWSRPSYYRGMCSHVEAVPDTVREMQAADPILGIPVTLLTPSQASPLCEQSLMRIGDHVQQVIAPASAHWIHLDQPDLVIDSIRQMMTSAGTMPIPV